MEQSNRTTTVKPGASSGESAIALLQHAVEALRNHPQDAHAGLVAGRIVNYLKTFPTHAVVAYLVKGADGKAAMHRVDPADWPEWADDVEFEEPAERCESGSPECGPVTNHDSEGVPLCATCWAGLEQDSADGAP